MIPAILLAGVAWGQSSENIPFGCKPIPLRGTVQRAAVIQARETNAQLYSAASFTERVILPRMQQKVANEETGLVWATEVSTLSGVSFVPSRERDCPPEFAYTNHRVDLFGSATGLAFNFGALQFYYAGSLTGHMYAKRVTSGFVPYAYGLGTALAGPLATVPLTYIDVANDEGTSSLTGDYFLGAHVELPKRIGYASAAFIGSQGLFANAQGRVVRLFASAAVTGSGLDYLKAGLNRQKASDDVGASSLFLRDQEFVAPEEASAPARPATSFRTGHVSQEDIGGWVDLHFAYAFAPSAFIHDLRGGIHTPAYAFGKRVLDEGEGFYDFEDARGEGWTSIPVGIQFGRVTLPPLPFYGVPGGDFIHLQAEAFMIFAGGDTGGVLLMYTFKANDPETLAAFPYATDALSHYFTIQVF